MNETIMHDLVTKHVPRLDDLKRTTRDRFCSYDAYNDHVIVEYKARRKFYEGSTQLELPKYEKNMSDKRQYLYVVYDGVDKIQLWNVTKLARWVTISSGVRSLVLLLLISEGRRWLGRMSESWPGRTLIIHLI